MSEQPAAPKLRPESVLAERIFIDLVGRDINFVEGVPKMSTSAENFAKLSFKLAEAFLAADQVVRASEGPKNPTFKLGTDDIAAWMKK